MVGLGFILGGAAEGLGTSIVQEAQTRREMALQMLREDRADARAARGDAAVMERLDRQAEIEDTRARRDREWEYGDKKREVKSTPQTGGEYMTRDDGSTVRVLGDRASTVRDEAGEPLRGLRTNDRSPPADVAAAEWLIGQGVAEDPAAAWDMVRSARQNPADRARLITSLVESQNRNLLPGQTARPLAEQTREAELIVDQLLRGPATQGGERGEQGQGGADQPAPVVRDDETPPAPRPGPGAGTNVGAAAGRVERRELPAGMTQDDILAQAARALESGREPAAVRRRLAEYGIDPSALDAMTQQGQ